MREREREGDWCERGSEMAGEDEGETTHRWDNKGEEGARGGNTLERISCTWR